MPSQQKIRRLRHEPPRRYRRLLAPPNVRGTRCNLLWRTEHRRLPKARRKGISSTPGERRTTPAMASRRPRPSNPAVRIGGGARRRRGYVMFVKPLPRYVIAKPLASGLTGFYFNIPTKYRKLGCTIQTMPWGPIMRSLAARMAPAVARKLSTDFSMSGTRKTRSGEFLLAVYTDTAPLIGYFGNTNRAKRILKRSRNDPALITSAPC